MKTSTKLIIGFLGFLLFMLLLTDITIWANYKKGITNEEWIGVNNGKVNREAERKILPASVQPFKVLVVFNTDVIRRSRSNADSTRVEYSEEVRQTNRVELVQEEAWSVTAYEGGQFTRKGDTLLITLTSRSGGFRVAIGKEAPEIINHAAWMDISGIYVDNLAISSDTSARTVINNSGIGQFTYRGGRNTRLEISTCPDFNHADISFADGGAISLYDVYFKQHRFNFDDKVDVSMNGKSVKIISGQ
ncbi:hypothetical protein [Chitinophaga sp. CB10]|uniref:hypothetical protein n=1 Tax=Chitinophaga sp. CB10 TaxID=1891659 RepID=UPI0025BC1F26|nr:hypothetical protein [Chitinophaga sp. CB10]